MTEGEPRGFFDAFSATVTDATTLARLDAMLLRAELKASLATFVKVIILGAIAMIFTIVACAFLASAGFYSIVQAGASPLVAALIIVGISLLIVLLLLVAILSLLKNWTIAPTRTLAQFRSNIAAIKTGFVDANAKS